MTTKMTIDEVITGLRKMAYTYGYNGKPSDAEVDLTDLWEWKAAEAVADLLIRYEVEKERADEEEARFFKANDELNRLYEKQTAALAITHPGWPHPVKPINA